MITFTVFVCILAILFRILYLGRRIKKKELLFCECKIYGKFVDSEISIDNFKFRLIDNSFE